MKQSGPSMGGFPYIFTFYSFKGGVGRSMAVLNTAYTLAGWGKHVLIVDLDLEAPGVSGFLDRHNELAAPEGEHPLDVLTLLSEVVTAVNSGTPAATIAAELPPLENYLRSVSPENLKPMTPKIGSLGRLDVLSADMKRDWCRRLARLGLQGMPQDRLIEVSTALHFYFKNHRFPHIPLGLVEPKPTSYDYILVDSRTGITEIGGMCVGPLADRLVILSSLNDQNIEGTRTFLEESGIQPKARESDAPPWDDGDLPAKIELSTLGPKPTLLVASPVPTGEIDFKRSRLNEMERRLAVRPLRLSYHPQMALFESIFVRDYQDEYLAGEYLTLANAFTRLANDHPSQLAAAARPPFGQVDQVASAQAVLRLAAQEPQLGISLIASLADSFSPKTDEEEECLLRIYGLLAGVPEYRPGAMNNWGNALLAQTKLKGDTPLADDLFAQACEKFAEAVRIKPDMHEAFHSWGTALLVRAKLKRDIPLADDLFTQASGKFAEALRIKPDMHEAFYNWGNALLAQAQLKGDSPLADDLFSQASEKFAEAVRIRPDKHEAFHGWGNTLLAQAKLKGDTPLGLDLFAQASGKYAEAVRIKPDNHEAFSNWGTALLEQAQLKGDSPLADDLFAEAGEKFAEAVRIKPDLHEAFYNWGIALLAQAKLKVDSPLADGLFAEAGEKFAEAVRIKPDLHEAWFNLACLTAIRKKPDETINALTKWKSFAPTASRSKLDGDRDFDSVREDPAFQSFRDSLPE